MLNFVMRRLASTVPTLFLVITIAFFLIRLAPGGPFDLEQPLEAKVMENLRRIYQLDQPLWKQYASYLGAIATGDLGPSFYYRDFSVADLFAKALPISIRLGASHFFEKPVDLATIAQHAATAGVRTAFAAGLP